MRSFMWYAIGFACGMIVMAAPLSSKIRSIQAHQSTCQEELEICKQTLNDPHACVSIVVEILEGKDVR